MSDLEKIESLCNDGEMLAGLVVRFRERVAAGQQFKKTLSLLEWAERELAGQMNPIVDVVSRMVADESVNANKGG